MVSFIWSIGLFLSLLAATVRAVIVIELNDVLYTASVPTLCEEVIDFYSIALPTLAPTKELYCANTTLYISEFVFAKNLEIVSLSGVTMTTVVSGVPTGLNTILENISFFPNGVGSVSLVSNRLETRLAVWLVFVMLGVVAPASGFMVYKSISTK